LAVSFRVFGAWCLPFSFVNNKVAPSSYSRVVWQGIYQLCRQTGKGLLFIHLVELVSYYTSRGSIPIISSKNFPIIWAVWALYFNSCTFKDHLLFNPFEFISPNLPLSCAVTWRLRRWLYQISKGNETIKLNWSQVFLWFVQFCRISHGCCGCLRKHRPASYPDVRIWYPRALLLFTIKFRSACYAFR
jgi:hypothetical protein